MQSDEAKLNEFERSILERMADQLPALLPVIPELAVSSRELTGVGSFTNFASHHVEVRDRSNGPLALDCHISMQGVRNGLGALLFFNVSSIAFLEIFAYGDDAWGGNWEGYSLGERCIGSAL
jgi:hypothetical protein